MLRNRFKPTRRVNKLTPRPTRRSVWSDPLVTDWIQAVAVAFGIVAAVWQFVIHDRQANRQSRQAVVDLIVAGQSDVLVSAAQAAINWPEKLAPSRELDEIVAKLLPLEAHLEAWAFCYEQSLCERALVLEYSCNNVLSLSFLKSQISEGSNRTRFTYTSAAMKKLVADCEVHVK